MTTAHRPTFDPARGKEAQRGPAYHQRLLPAHTHLKVRQAGQGGAAGLGSRDLKQELQKAEQAVHSRRGGDLGVAGVITESDAVTKGDDTSKRAFKDEDEDEDAEVKRRRTILEEAHDIDADSVGSSSSDDSEEEDEEEDEEAELMRELAKIKAERAAAKKAEEEAQAAKDQEKREMDIALGNPLLNKQQEFGIKRRWDDDVVFKNQARGTEDKGKRKEFVNDLLRSDFHKRFMVRRFC